MHTFACKLVIGPPEVINDSTISLLYDELGNAVWSESSDPTRIGRARLHFMKSLGLIDSTCLPVVEMLDLEEPLASWLCPSQSHADINGCPTDQCRFWGLSGRH